MSTSRGQRDGVTAAAAAANFFKVIMDPQADSLIIPAEFIRRYEHNLPNPVFLKVPTGSVMEVELMESSGETMLHKGWLEFKERYSIRFGHFLVFAYNGNSQFDVIIFDMTAVEINYPFDANYKRVANQDSKLEDNGMELDDDSVVFLEEFSTGNRGKGKAQNLENTQTENDNISMEILDNPLARQQNRRKSRRCDDVIEISDDYPVRKSIRPTHNLSSCLKKGSRSKFSSPNYDEPTSEEYSDDSESQCSDSVQIQRAVVKETCVAYQKAFAFISGRTTHNPFFISLMQSSYVSRGCNLNMPASFAKGNLPCMGANIIILSSNGKKWSVRCNFEKKKAHLSTGWKDFVQDNGLTVGDACVFEVAKSAKLVWDVVIFHS